MSSSYTTVSPQLISLVFKMFVILVGIWWGYLIFTATFRKRKRKPTCIKYASMLLPPFTFSFIYHGCMHDSPNWKVSKPKLSWQGRKLNPHVSALQVSLIRQVLGARLGNSTPSLLPVSTFFSVSFMPGTIRFIQARAALWTMAAVKKVEPPSLTVASHSPWVIHLKHHSPLSHPLHDCHLPYMTVTSSLHTAHSTHSPISNTAQGIIAQSNPIQSNSLKITLLRIIWGSHPQ